MCLPACRVASLSTSAKLSEIASATPDENRLLGRKTLLNPRASSRILSSRSDDELRMMYSVKEYSRADRDFIKAIENFDFGDYACMCARVIPGARFFNVGKISRNRFCASSPQTRKTRFNLRSFPSTLELSKSTVKIDTFDTSSSGLTKEFC